MTMSSRSRTHRGVSLVVVVLMLLVQCVPVVAQSSTDPTAVESAPLGGGTDVDDSDQLEFHALNNTALRALIVETAISTADACYHRFSTSPVAGFPSDFTLEQPWSAPRKGTHAVEIRNASLDVTVTVYGPRTTYPLSIRRASTGGLEITLPDDGVEYPFDYAILNVPRSMFSTPSPVSLYRHDIAPSDPQDLTRLPTVESLDGWRVYAITSHFSLLDDIWAGVTNAIGGCVGGHLGRSELKAEFQKLNIDATGLDYLAGDMVCGFIPGVGTAKSISDLVAAAKQGDLVLVGLSAAGAIPVGGGIVKVLKKGSKSFQAASLLGSATKGKYLLQCVIKDERGSYAGTTITFTDHTLDHLREIKAGNPTPRIEEIKKAFGDPIALLDKEDARLFTQIRAWALEAVDRGHYGQKNRIYYKPTTNNPNNKYLELGIGTAGKPGEIITIIPRNPEDLLKELKNEQSENPQWAREGRVITVQLLEDAGIRVDL